MLIDAIVLAGGRSERLGGIAKASLIHDGQTLLVRALATVENARSVVVVGDPGAGPLPARVLVTREDPPFSGPAAGVAAGVAALAASGSGASEITIVLACDMPNVSVAVHALLEALPPASETDGVIAIDANDRLQPLAAVYRTEKLRAAIAEHRRTETLNGLSMFKLISPLNLTPVPVPPGSTDDVDTWADADRFGVCDPTQRTPKKGTP